MLAVGDQIQIVGEFYTLCNLLEDVDAETFATAFDVNPWISCMITDRQYKKRGGGWLLKTELPIMCICQSKQTACELKSKAKQINQESSPQMNHLQRRKSV